MTWTSQPAQSSSAQSVAPLSSSSSSSPPPLALEDVLHEILHSPLLIIDIRSIDDYTSFYTSPRLSHTFTITYNHVIQYPFILPSRDVSYVLLTYAHMYDDVQSVLNKLHYYPKYIILIHSNDTQNKDQDDNENKNKNMYDSEKKHDAHNGTECVRDTCTNKRYKISSQYENAHDREPECECECSTKVNGTISRVDNPFHHIPIHYIQLYDDLLSIASSLQSSSPSPSLPPSYIDSTVLTSPPIAFSPCPLLRTYIDMIEDMLLKLYTSTSQPLPTSESNDNSNDHHKENGKKSVARESHDVTVAPGSTKAKSYKVRLKCLSLGCGSGRDDLWLAATRPANAAINNHTILYSSMSSSLQQSHFKDILKQHTVNNDDMHANTHNNSTTSISNIDYEWHLTSIDSADKALSRLQEFAKLYHVDTRIHTIEATIADGDVSVKQKRLRHSDAETSDSNNKPSHTPIPTALISIDHDSTTARTSPLTLNPCDCGVRVDKSNSENVNDPSSLTARQQRQLRAKLKQQQEQHESGSAVTSNHVTPIRRSLLQDLHLQQHDMILGVRFLCRPMFPKMHTLVRNGGLLCWQTFVRDSRYELKHPSNPAYVLNEDELGDTFNESTGWRILVDDVIQIPDGRPVTNFIAQKI